MEHKGMDLNTQRSYILLLKFISQMTFHKCSFTSTTITKQCKFELKLGFSLGSHRDVNAGGGCEGAPWRRRLGRCFPARLPRPPGPGSCLLQVQTGQSGGLLGAEAGGQFLS